MRARPWLMACLAGLTLFPLTAAAETEDAAVVEFHIADGTGSGAWNTRDTLVELRLGDTLRIVNDDAVRHRLHTAGAPCAHTPDILPGESHDCQVTRPYDATTSGPLFDHYVGPRTSAFWVRAVR